MVLLHFGIRPGIARVPYDQRFALQLDGASLWIKKGRAGPGLGINGLWLRVDACFGGFFRMTKRGRIALKGIEEADSIAGDAHKSLFLPHGLSALLVKDRSHLLATFEVPDSPYLPGTHDMPELIDF